MITLLDGPVGSLLPRWGVATDGPAWSAEALTVAPEVVGQIHKAYAAAGARVHTANTFRTKERQVGAAWQRLTRKAVEIARGAVPLHHRVAGSIAPLADCYRPDLSPANARLEHRAMAEVLCSAGCDVLLCETFPHVGEALIAVSEAVRTEVPTWVSFTAGPDGTLLSPRAVAEGAAEAIRRGASAVLVNCTSATLTLTYVEALAGVAGRVPFGAYANAGFEPDGIGGFAEGVRAGEAAEAARAERYAAVAATWVAAGATLIGSCCGTGPAHIAQLYRTFLSANGSSQ